VAGAFGWRAIVKREKSFFEPAPRPASPPLSAGADNFGRLRPGPLACFAFRLGFRHLGTPARASPLHRAGRTNQARHRRATTAGPIALDGPSAFAGRSA